MKTVIIDHRPLLETTQNLAYCSCREWSVLVTTLPEADELHAEHLEQEIRKHLSESLGSTLVDADRLIEESGADSWAVLERADEEGLCDIVRESGGVPDPEFVVAADLDPSSARYVAESAKLLATLITVLEPQEESE